VAATREQLLMQAQQFGKRSEKPPKLPPRDANNYHHDVPKVSHSNDDDQKMTFIAIKSPLQPDYDGITSENRIKLLARGKSDKGKDNKKYGEHTSIYNFFHYCTLTVSEQERERHFMPMHN
jgi:hypothetical protein